MNKNAGIAEIAVILLRWSYGGTRRRELLSAESCDTSSAALVVGRSLLSRAMRVASNRHLLWPSA
jgi:hypothetical protein